MLIISFVVTLTVIVIITIWLHIFLKDYITNFDKGVQKKKQYWIQVIKQCEISGNYHMQKRKIIRLANPQFLKAFYSLLIENENEVCRILEQNDYQICRIIKKNNSKTVKAYFAYILGKIPENEKKVLEKYSDLMFEFLTKDSVYMRENALKVLYHLGNSEKIVRAFECLSEQYIFHSVKLLTDGLMTYGGSSEELVRDLCNSMTKYKECYQTAIVNFISYQGISEYDDVLLMFLRATTYIDLKCSILRLIGRNVSEDNKRILIEYLRMDKEESNWETASVAARMLGNYVGDEGVIEVLSRAICSRNWYVRNNSAISLSQICTSPKDLTTIFEGGDSYAIQALTYALKKQEEK